MSFVKNVSSRKPIKILVFAKFALVSDCLKKLLESKSEIKIVNFATTSEEIIPQLSKNEVSVVLMHFVADEFDPTEEMEQLLAHSPNTKLLVISDLNESMDQTKLLKLGVSGIVGTHQKEEVLIRAIRQVSEGGVWFSQTVMAQLLGNGTNGNGTNGNGTSGGQNGKLNSQALTRRELEVVESIALGLSNKDIADRLIISEATVRHHLSSIYSKLYISDRLNLVIYAYQTNIVRAPI
jgi:DNA-binding NarL/FixJ family response regulator